MFVIAITGLVAMIRTVADVVNIQVPSDPLRFGFAEERCEPALYPFADLGIAEAQDVSILETNIVAIVFGQPVLLNLVSDELVIGALRFQPQTELHLVLANEIGKICQPGRKLGSARCPASQATFQAGFGRSFPPTGIHAKAFDAQASGGLDLTLEFLL